METINGRHRAIASAISENTTSWHFCASGFNAHGQLHESEIDLHSFRSLPPSFEPDLVLLEPQIIFLGWSETTFATPEFIRDEDGTIDRAGSHLLIRYGGVRNNYYSNLITCAYPAKNLFCGFGDHNDLLGVLTTEGEVYFMRPRDRSPTYVPLLELKSGDGSPRLAQIALAGNGRIAITFIQAPTARLAHISEFESFASFASWYILPDDPAYYPSEHHMISGHAKQLISNATTFTCLMDTGEVYTWGDVRHRSLGRNTIGEGATEAGRAGLLEALAGVRITKISGGGWITAAVSEDGAAYLWGANTPGTEDVVKAIDGLGETEVALIQIPGPDGEPLDVLDVAVGAGHIVLLVETGRVFVCGDNANGQLGLGSRRKFFADWEEVTLAPGTRCLEVFAGPKYSLLKIKKNHESRPVR